MYSGTLAIESALRIAGITRGDKVLFNNLACYSVLEAVINVGGIPVLMNPATDKIVLDSFEVINIIKAKGIKCFIAIHQYGIYQEIELIKKQCPEVIIIEDLSQAWNIKSVSNIEKTKPLSFGIGGVLLTNNKLLLEKTDLRDRNSRYKESSLISYMIPLDFDIDLPMIMHTGDNNVSLQRDRADYYKHLFSELQYVSVVHENEGYQYSWHRYPIFVNNSYEKVFEKLLEQLEIPYQKEFSISLNQLKMAKDAINIGNRSSKKLYLLRTRI